MTRSCQLFWPPPYSNALPEQMELLSAAIFCLFNFLFCAWFSSVRILQRTPTSKSWSKSFFFQTRKKIDEYFERMPLNESFNHSESYTLFKLKKKKQTQTKKPYKWIPPLKRLKLYYRLYINFPVKMLLQSFVLAYINVIAAIHN